MYKLSMPVRLVALTLFPEFLGLIAACGVAATPTPVPWETTTFKVPAGNEYRLALPVPAGARIEYKFNADLDINVWLLDPLGNRMVGADRVERASGRGTAKSLGTYVLLFDNSYSLFTGKSVNLTYRVLSN